MSPEQMAKELGILPCECTGECWFCGAEDVRVWWKDGRTVAWREEDYFVCEECLPARYQAYVDEWANGEVIDES